jgi:SPP1 family predicted phage head-tail adaptor
MNLGRLDRRIALQRKTVTRSPSGQPIETWSPLVARRWASVAPVLGDERFTAPQYAALEQVEFRLRWSSDVASVTPLDRIVYPAPAASSPPPPIAEHDLYDVLAVHEIGRRAGLRIVTARRVDKAL